MPVGSLTQLGTIRLGKRTDGRSPKIKDFVKLAKLDDIVFGGWDIFPDNAYEAAAKAGVLEAQDLAKVKKFLSKIKPMKRPSTVNYVKMLDGTNVKKGKTKFDLALQIQRRHPRNSKRSTARSRLVMVWCGSTEVFHEAAGRAQDLRNRLKRP